MTYILIDNATLTGVQRLLGQVPVRSREAVEADIGALENLLEGILLYDDVVAIDDYKPEFRAERRAAFPFVRSLDPADFGLPSVAEAAEIEADTVRPEIHGGDFVDDDFKAFFEALRTHLVCVWNMQSSVFHLTVKYLGESGGAGFEKYGALSQAIFHELSDQSRAGELQDARARLVDSRGHPIIDRSGPLEPDGTRREGEISDSLKAFLASLNWLAHRTIFYALAAEHLRGDVALYPIRQVFHRHYMERTGRFDGTFVAEVTRVLAGETRGTVEDVIAANRAARVALSLPLFSAWLVKETGDVRQVVDAALELKNDSRIARTREQLKELRVLFDEEDVEGASRRIQKIRTDLQKGLNEVRLAFGLQTTQGPTVATVVNAYNAVKPGGTPGLPALGARTPLFPEFMRRWRQKGAGALYRDVGLDLALFPKLGEIRDMLGKAVFIRPDGLTNAAKAEDPAYRFARPWWKRPM